MDNQSERGKYRSEKCFLPSVAQCTLSETLVGFNFSSPNRRITEVLGEDCMKVSRYMGFVGCGVWAVGCVRAVGCGRGAMKSNFDKTSLQYVHFRSL